MRKPNDTTQTIPLVQEQLSVEKRTTETGRVRIRTKIAERLARVAEDLEHDDVRIERVVVNQEVTEAPQPREENGVLIIPVLEEVIVVEKRPVLKEEIHVRRNRKREHVEQAVSLRHMEVEVARLGAPDAGDSSELEAGRVKLRGERLRRKEPLDRHRK